MKNQRRKKIYLPAFVGCPSIACQRGNVDYFKGLRAASSRGCFRFLFEFGDATSSGSADFSPKLPDS